MYIDWPSESLIMLTGCHYHRWKNTSCAFDANHNHFGHDKPSWILRKMKNSFAGLFQWSSSMSMPNLSESDEPDPSYCKKCELAAMGVLGSDGSPQHFDHRRPSWILRKMKNSFAGLFQGSSSMSMPTFVWIRWAGSKLLQKMWGGANTPPPAPVKKQFIELPTFQWELKTDIGRNLENHKKKISEY